MNNVKNNHDAPLSIAGVTVAPGATVGIDSNTLHASLNSNGVKTWLKLGLIEVEGLNNEQVIPVIPVAAPTREQLEKRAAELGVSFQGNTKDETLANKIAEAEAAAE